MCFLNGTAESKRASPRTPKKSDPFVFSSLNHISHSVPLSWLKELFSFRSGKLFANRMCNFHFLLSTLLSYYLPFAQRVTLQRTVGHRGLNGPIVLHHVGGASSSVAALAIVSITTVRAPRCRPETATYRSVTSDVSSAKMILIVNQILCYCTIVW